MLKQLINFYKVSSPRPCNGEALSSSGSQHLHSDARRLKYLKWFTFLSATFGYGMYYVCRLSLNVVKKPIVDEGIFSVRYCSLLTPLENLRMVFWPTVAISTAL
mgnify:CR=1 FL=1